MMRITNMDNGIKLLQRLYSRSRDSKIRQLATNSVMDVWATKTLCGTVGCIDGEALLCENPDATGSDMFDKCGIGHMVEFLGIEKGGDDYSQTTEFDYGRIITGLFFWPAHYRELYNAARNMGQEFQAMATYLESLLLAELTLRFTEINTKRGEVNELEKRLKDTKYGY